MKALRLVLLLTFVSPAAAFLDPLYYFIVDLVCAFLGIFGIPCGVANDRCLDSGGAISMASCCISTEDFPNTCVIGACGCAPANSKETKVCNCPMGQCFDGTECVLLSQYGCVSGGGAVSTAFCCNTVGDFPNTCLSPGACGCAPVSSKQTKVCNCPTNQCFDGTECVLLSEYGCISGGGAVSTASCCNSVGDFPNTCLSPGACGCAPVSSKQTKVCNCPTNQCFDGSSCMPIF